MSAYNKKMKDSTPAYLIPIAREKLRSRAMEQSDRLARSVARRTSCDMLPCPEYRELVQQEVRWLDDLAFTQHCRAVLEQAIHSGSAKLAYTEISGRKRIVRFTMTPNNRVQVKGLSL